MKKGLSVILCLVMALSVITVVPVDIAAKESDIVETGATSGTTGDCTWTLDDNGVLTISGNGKMEDYSWFIGTPWRPNIRPYLNPDIVDVT